MLEPPLEFLNFMTILKILSKFTNNSLTWSESISELQNKFLTISSTYKTLNKFLTISENLPPEFPNKFLT
jgi:hypothetical protein